MKSMRQLIPFALVVLAVGCSSNDPVARVKRNVADREAIQKEGVELRQKGLCTIEATAVADDPDRHFLACAGFATAAGADPGILAFREQHRKDDDFAIVAACHDLETPVSDAVTLVICNPTLDRFRAEASRNRQALVSAGRCTNAALRASTEADKDWFLCHGHRRYFPPYIHLDAFRQRFGPDVATVQQRCSQLGVELRATKEAVLAERRETPGYRPPADSLVHFETAYKVFCTETTPGGLL